MKKIFTIMLAAAMAATMLTAGAFCSARTGCIDADNDGVCDNRTGSSSRCIDADGDGVCDNRVAADTDGARGGRSDRRGGCGRRSGCNYSDANGDGVCDNAGSRCGRRNINK